jgi:beta propeller repeat protein
VEQCAPAEEERRALDVERLPEDWMTMRTGLALRAATLFTATLFAGCDGGEIELRDTGLAPDAGPIVMLDGGPIGTDAGSDAGPSCVDVDGDGYGEGCDLGADCDDTNGQISPAADEVCNGEDDDCDGSDDEDVTLPACELTEGVCAGAVARCRGTDGFMACDATDYGAEYEPTSETLNDGEDNDCDGSTDEGLECSPGASRDCGTDEGVCVAGTQSCTDGTWGACEGETGPMGEICDGLDNDCDAEEDEADELSPPACPLQLGVCAGSARSCGGVGGWIACSGTASYGGDYQRIEDICDGLDNDCDGITDESCSCIDGQQQGCGSDVGACVTGTQTCTAGAWGGCAGEVAPIAESCNGADDDCDGSADESLIAPACALTAGVCAGSTQRCTGAGGFVACTAADYGTNYEATESRCDGLDNDCDGMVDEGCDCIDGRTQECGSSTGACERGMQTCSGGLWGSCTGGVGPAAEECNGIDDDCNGVSDDSLRAPACSLTSGVCMGSAQTCGGTRGWIACTGTDSYGPRYLGVEPGSTDEGVCDGLDNDCDGMEDEDCASGPIAFTAQDEVLPDLYHQHLVYSVNFDGNWDLVFVDFNRGAAMTRRLTTTTQSELLAKVYGNHVVFVRNTGTANARVFLYDLVTGTETPLTTRQADNPTIAGSLVVWQEFDGTQWELHFYDIASRSGSSVFATPLTASNEERPALRGGRLAYVGSASGAYMTYVVDLSDGTAIMQVPSEPTIGQGSPAIDYLVVGWNDGRNAASPTGMPTDNIDLFGAPLSDFPDVVTFPGDNPIETAINGQYLSDVDGAVYAWNDYRNGNWDPAIGSLGGGGGLVISRHPATQADPTISGNIVAWEDNRLGNYDIYGAQFGGAVAPDAMGWLLINEILADPNADTNGDGVLDSSTDEMVEIVNATGFRTDISGCTLSDGQSVRHTFPAGTVLPAAGTIVVFGGGGIGTTRRFGGARVQLATGGQLSLNNTGDTLTVTCGATPIDAVTYGSAADNNESLVRSPEIASSGFTFVRHSTMTGSVGPSSPGTTARGFGF